MENKGLNTDFSPILQPEGTYRYALNAVNQTTNGDFGFLSKELSAEASAVLPTNYKIIGSVYIGDDNVLLFLVFNNISEIGILNKNETYTTLINTRVLSFDERYPIRATFRSRKNNERTVYFVDGLNKPRCVNIDKLYNYYTLKYTEWLQLGKLSSTFKKEKWDSSKFNLIKSYTKIPSFENVEILETGSIKSGSYCFGVMYLDEDLNHTNVVTTSNPVIIYNDNLNKEYSQIRGSRNIESAIMSYSVTNKAIKLSLSNLDSSYPFYKIVIIQTNEMTGKPNKAVLSDIISISEGTFVYDGNDTSLNTISLDEIAIDKDDINNVEFITQIENRLILGKYRTKNVDYAGFQQYASKISSHLTTKKVYLNSIKSYGNAKDPLSSFENIGYMPGEVYSFGICYVFNDGTISPAYHIPGRNKRDIREAVNGFNDNMDYYETPDSKYPEIHSSINRANYWGKDNYGDYLMGRPKRHHKFPSRKSRNIPLYERTDSQVILYKYVLTATISLKENKEYPKNIITNEPVLITCNLNYKKENAYSNSEYITTINDSITKENFVIKVYENEYPLEKIDGLYGTVSGEILDHIDKFRISFHYDEIPQETLSPAFYTEVFGIRFDNIELPHPDVVGYFIVRNERLDADKIVVDNALVGPVTKHLKDNVDYRVFNKWVNVSSSLDPHSVYFFSPNYQFYGKTLDFDHIDVQGYFSTTKMTSYNHGEPPSSGDYNTREYGIVLADIAEGTSYNPDVHSGSDGDGFNLLIGYRNSTLKYNSLNEGDIKWSYDSEGASTIDNIFYVGAANSKFYDGKTFYNACQDNKIGFIKFASEHPMFSDSSQRELLFGTTNTKLYYASLVLNNDSAYTNFIDRDYFKEHNNVVYFNSNGYGEPVTIFNGDAHVNACTTVASTYYGMKMANRKKKDKKSSGILGVALIVVGVVATLASAGAALGVFGVIGTAGTTASAIAMGTIAGVGTALGSMAISAGASMYSSYLELEALKKMLSEDYPKGLQDAIKDRDMSDHPTSDYPYGCGLEDGTSKTDDAIIWFADRLTDLFLESSVNFGLRTSLNSIGVDFINPLSNGGNKYYSLYSRNYTEFNGLLDPLNSVIDTVSFADAGIVDMTGFDEEEFRSYLVEKLTVIAEGGSTSSTSESYSLTDSNTTTSQGTISGRVYRGYASTEWYDVNPDYHVKNTHKTFVHLPITYNSNGINGDYSQKYNNRLIYSQQAFQEEQTDNYRVFLVNNYKDMDAEFGAITGLFKIGNNLYVHTSEGLWQVPRNIQEKVTNQLTTYIGTGEFLALSPLKLDDGLTSYGSQSDFSTVITNYGVFFTNQRTGQVFMLTDKGATNISDSGMLAWFKHNLRLNIKNQLYELSQYKWKLNNPMIGSGIFAAYDPILNRILLTKKDYEFTKTSNFVGTFSNEKLDYNNGDIFIGSKESSNGIYDDNIFYIVDTPHYLSKRKLSFADFVSENNIIINDIQLVETEKFTNVTGYWYNRNQYTYETIDYGNTDTFITINDEINWSNLSINRPNGLNSEYINAYFEFDFTPAETKEYSFYIKTSGEATLYVNDVVISDSYYMEAGTVYSMRLDFIHAVGNPYIVCGISAVTTNNGSLEKTSMGTIKYTPQPGFEGEDIFYVITDKTTDGQTVDQISISVKNREGDEQAYPYFHLINQTQDPSVVYISDSISMSEKTEGFTSKYRKVSVFPCETNGILRMNNSITVPHKITIIYGDNQSFTIDNLDLWNPKMKDEYAFNIRHDGVNNYLTVIIDCNWTNPNNNDAYIKSVFYTVDYDV